MRISFGPSEVARLIAALMLAAAPASWPYGYYTFLRLVVSIVCAWHSYESIDRGHTVWFVVFGLAALLFNPVIPVHLTKEIWLPINLGLAVTLVASLWLARPDAFRSKQSA